MTRVGLAFVLLIGVALAGCNRSPPEVKAEKGEPGPPGAAGPPGPAGPAGPAGASSIRFADSTCTQAACTAGCNDNERIVNAYAPAPGGTIAGGAIVFNDDKTVSFRPRRPPARLVVVCAGAS